MKKLSNYLLLLLTANAIVLAQDADTTAATATEPAADIPVDSTATATADPIADILDTTNASPSIITNTNTNTGTDTDAGTSTTTGVTQTETTDVTAIGGDSLSIGNLRERFGIADPTGKTEAVRPKIAVYVTGGKDVAANRALATYMLDAVAASNRYTPIERSDVFLAEVDNEHAKQRSGAIDDSQISALGKQSGVRYVCVADITQALRGYQVSARIIDVETAEVVTVGVSSSPLKTMDHLRSVSADVAMAMLRKIYPDDYANVPVPEKKLRFGVRAAYHNSFVSDMDVRLETRNHLGERVPIKHSAEKGFSSSGAEFSVVALIGVTDKLTLNVSPGVVIRKPVVTDVSEVSETAINIPVLVEYRVMNSQFRAVAGVHADIPISTEVEWKYKGDKTDDDDIKGRADADFGLTAGVSYYFLKNFSVDARAALGLREFDGVGGRLLYQATVGVSALY